MSLNCIPFFNRSPFLKSISLVGSSLIMSYISCQATLSSFFGKFFFFRLFISFCLSVSVSIIEFSISVVFCFCNIFSILWSIGFHSFHISDKLYISCVSTYGSLFIVFSKFNVLNKPGSFAFNISGICSCISNTNQLSNSIFINMSLHQACREFSLFNLFLYFICFTEGCFTIV